MRHRLDLGMALASDQWIIEHTNDLTATLWFLTQHAINHNDWGWLTRHYWWLKAATRLNRGEAHNRARRLSVARALRLLSFWSATRE